MEATAWKGATYGVRVGRANAESYFQMTWAFIEVELDGEIHCVKLPDSFWRKCPELKSAAIGRWLRKHQLAPWPKGDTPKLKLLPLKGTRFRLSA
jgi:hypothetical protein